MAQKIYIVEGRQFRTEIDYNRALRDKELADRLREQAEEYSVEQLKQLKQDLHNDKYRFLTLIGRDFEDEIDELIEKRLKNPNNNKKKVKKTTLKKSINSKNAAKKVTKTSAIGKQSTSKLSREELEKYAKEELARREKLRRRLMVLCAILALGCLGYFGVYSYYDYKTRNSYDKLNELKDKPLIQQATSAPNTTVSFTLDEEKEAPEVLDEYKNLLNTNKKLIGWVKIDDTNIDYPVMQTTNNEYYLDHNLNQEYDKNGSIFMDKDCDVVKPSTNYILYGHHMKSGKMFGKLHLYAEESYYKEHPYIEFDTIYEKGIYQVMYAFRSKVYSEEEIVFKYYQFIDAYSEQEFNSYMQEMAALSYYDTGVTAEFGDQLLTLSTCYYQEKNGRFVVVAKKVTAKE